MENLPLILKELQIHSLHKVKCVQKYFVEKWGLVYRIIIELFKTNPKAQYTLSYHKNVEEGEAN